MTQTENIGTFILTNADSPFTILRNMGVTALALEFIAGAVTYYGPMKLSNGSTFRLPDAIPLEDGKPFSAVGTDPIDGFVITIPGGASCYLTTRN